MKMFWRVLQFRKSSSCKPLVNEKAVEGYRSYEICSKPPRSSVLPLVYASGDHAGYANCIRLYNGENGLVTAYHNGINLFVVGKTNNKIHLDKFKELFAHPASDIRVLVGPPNWEGVLGCKGVHFVTGDRVGKCPASFFTFDKEGWKSKSATIAGSYDRFATVLSNTEPGDSGTGYFNGKTLLGIHKGHPGDGENFNLMSVIPPIEGVTTPKFVFETTMPQGKIFSEEMIRVFREEIPLFYKPVGGGLSWADLVDQEFGNEKLSLKPTFVTPKFDFHNEMLPIPKSGNDLRSSDCLNNRNSNIPIEEEHGSKTKSDLVVPSIPTIATAMVIPTCQVATATSSDTSAQPDLAGKVVDNLCARVNLSKLEAAVVEKLASLALKGKPRRKRGKRGGKNKPESSRTTSVVSTTGVYVPPNQRFPVSANVGKSQATTGQPKKQKQNGGGGSVGNIPAWVRRPQAMGGPKMGPKPN